jgi:hypothetical protein
MGVRHLSPWFLVAPVLGMTLVGLYGTSVPLRARWAISKGAFERVALTAPPPTTTYDWQSFDVPRRIGAYRITSAARVRDALIFHEKNGAFFDDAGFAYLPSGPFSQLENGSFEAPEFLSLGDGWYAWTASW